jgi:hypothetical protein
MTSSFYPLYRDPLYNPQSWLQELTRVTTFLAYNESSLVIELKDASRDIGNEEEGLATHSNSESTVLSNASIFETYYLISKQHPNTNIE